MHSRVIASRSKGAHRAKSWLLILLAHVAPPALAAPYLQRIAPPALRERDVFVPAPVTPLVETVTTTQPSIPEPASEPAANIEPAAEPAPVETSPIAEVATPAPTTPVAPDPQPVLQDPLRERVQLEDFLPFFAPPSPPQPASRATYRRE